MPFALEAEEALHPSAGVRKAALQVLPSNSASLAAISKAGLFNDANLNTRLAAILKASDLPESAETGKELQSASGLGQNSGDRWISEALKVAMAKHVKAGEDSHAGHQMNGAANKAGDTKPAEGLGKPDQIVKITPVVNAMKFEQKSFSVKAGSIVELEFDNIDFMQHNLLILQKGSMEKVGAAADKMAQDPKGADKQYVPAMPEVLFFTPLVNPEDKFKLKFEVPAVTGDYPYICSFPGHW
ncbi:MAG: hypothetical protein EOO94_02700, partial [Pedobacter sp.]